MGEAISAILPQAIGAAISPIPIIAVILMLFTAKARVNAPIFALGWVLGLLVVAAIAYLVGDSQDVATDEDASNWAYILKVVLGVLLFLLAIKQWRSRPKSDDPPTAPPKWMQAIDQFSPVKAFGMGALLSGPNPKNLLLSIAAGTTIAQLGATGADAWVAIFVYALLGTVTVGGPVAYYFLAGESAEKNLNELKSWLGANNATVMTVLFVIFGISLLSGGLQGLFD
jgi:threonine/homoserine/homoserine lactone efflux protein